MDYFNGLGIDNYLSYAINGYQIYPLSDHLGSVNGITNETGYLMDQTDYDAYGNATNPNFQSMMKYAGLQSDPTTGFYYARARMYDPKIGRFISEDPIGLNGGINQFGYARNNPVSFKDPSGKIPVLIPIVIGVGVLIATSPSYVNAPNPTDRVYLDDKGSGLFISAAAGSACSMGFRAASPYIGSLINSLRIGDDIIELGISGGPTSVASKVASSSSDDLAGALTAEELKALQNLAGKYNTEFEVVGSRAAGKGRNIDTDLPVGKGNGTRSDIDLKIDGQADISSRGMLSHQLSDIAGGGLVRPMPITLTYPPYIRISANSYEIVRK